MKKVAFRVDGGRVWGLSMGHLYRCIALAKELMKRGVEVEFYMKDYREGVVVAMENVGVHNVHIGPDSFDEFYMIDYMLHSIDTSVYIFDMPDFSGVNFEFFRTRGIKTLAIDDLGKNKTLNADVVVNGSLVPEFHEYRVAEGETIFLVGAKYCVMSEMFGGFEREVSDKVENVLITMGGCDESDLTGRVLKALMGKNLDCNFHVVFGPGNVGKVVAKSDERFKFYHYVPSIAELMKKCDIGITAGGITMYEAISLGLPTIVIPAIEHEEKSALYAHNSGLISHLPQELLEDEDHIVEQFNAFCGDLNLRTRMSEACSKIFDGKGCERVANMIEEML